MAHHSEYRICMVPVLVWPQRQSMGAHSLDGVHPYQPQTKSATAISTTTHTISATCKGHTCPTKRHIDHVPYRPHSYAHHPFYTVFHFFSRTAFSSVLGSCFACMMALLWYCLVALALFVLTICYCYLLICRIAGSKQYSVIL